MEKFSKMASMGAMAAAGGIAALYFALVVLFRKVPGGGIDTLGWQVLSLAMFVPAAILVGVHVALGRQLKQGAGAAN